MLNKKVKDLMIPASEYGVVSRDATVLEAMKILNESQKNVPENLHPFRAVLVIDEHKKIIGKVGHLAFLKALEPKRRSDDTIKKLTDANVGEEHIETIMDSMKLLEEDVIDVSQLVKTIKISDIMHPTLECIDEERSVMEAMHKIIEWESLSVLVARGASIVGIIRLSDIYNEIEKYVMENCCN